MTKLKEFLQQPLDVTGMENSPNIHALEKLLTNGDLETSDPDLSDPDLKALEELFFMKVPVKSSQNDANSQAQPKTKTQNPETEIIGSSSSNKVTGDRQKKHSSKSNYSTFAQDSKLFKLLTEPDGFIANDERNIRREIPSDSLRRKELNPAGTSSSSPPNKHMASSSPHHGNRNGMASQLLAQANTPPLTGKSPAVSSQSVSSSGDSYRNRVSEKRNSSALRRLITSPIALTNGRNDGRSPGLLFSAKTEGVPPPNLLKSIKKEPDDYLQPACHQMEVVSGHHKPDSSEDHLSCLIKSALESKISHTQEREPEMKSVNGAKHLVLHQCDICDLVCTTWSSLMEHKKAHSAEKIHKCEVCCALFYTANELLDHLKTHIEDVKPVICDGCHSCFPDEKTLKEHRCSSGGDKQFNCSICQEVFSTDEMLNKHIKTHQLHEHLKMHTEDVKPVICAGCQACFPDEETLKEHKCPSVASKQYHCSVCKEEFSTEEMLNKHVKTHDKPKKFGCSKCKARFASLKAVKIHMKAHNRRKQQNCSSINVGNESSAQKRDSPLHKKKRKGKKPRSKCEICGKRFKSELRFKQHWAQHTGEKLFKCDECDMSFMVHRALAQHKKAHSGENLHSCPECGKCFSYMANLTTHLKTHFDEKPHACEQCGEKFAKRLHLVAHRKTHTEKVLYKCQQCGRVCPNYSQLKYHVRCHSAVRPFKCDQCPKSFPDKEKLAMHVMTHTGEKPYKCPLCDKRFVHKTSIKPHAKIHDKERSFNCLMCGAHFVYAKELMMHLKSHTEHAVADVMNGTSQSSETATAGAETPRTAKPPVKKIKQDRKVKIVMVNAENTHYPDKSSNMSTVGQSVTKHSSSNTVHSTVVNRSGSSKEPSFPGTVKVKQEPVDDYEVRGQSSHVTSEGEVQKWTVHNAQFISPM